MSLKLHVERKPFAASDKYFVQLLDNYQPVKKYLLNVTETEAKAKDFKCELVISEQAQQEGFQTS